MKHSQRDFFEEEGRPSKKGRCIEDEYDILDVESSIVPVKEDNQPVHRITVRPLTSDVVSSRQEIEEDSEKKAWYVFLGIMIVVLFIILSFMIYPIGVSFDPHQSPIYVHNSVSSQHQGQYPLNP